jgi:4'-phosphopantetheinyl transferase
LTHLTVIYKTTPSPPLLLPVTEAHVWYAFTDEIVDPEQLARYRAVLSAEEVARMERFHFDRHRHSFLVSHALVRAVLSLYADVPPASWTFAIGPNGKPEIAAPAVPLRFNLSHTQGLAAVIVARQRDVGVDVENVARRAIGLALAERYFAPAEVAALRALSEAQRQERFFAYWTLKEAYIKARGLGLALPLDGFAFDLDQPGPLRIAFAATLADDPAAWQFAQFRAGPVHPLAVAIHRPGAADLTITWRAIVPQVG